MICLIDFIVLSLLFDLFGTFRGPGFPQTIPVRRVEPEANEKVVPGRGYPIGFIALRHVRPKKHLDGTIIVVLQVFVRGADRVFLQGVGDHCVSFTRSRMNILNPTRMAGGITNLVLFISQFLFIF